MTDMDKAELGFSAADRRLVLIGFPVVGAVVGALLPFVWRLVEDVEWIPFQGPLTALMSLDHGWQSLVRIVILMVVGLAFGGFVVADEVRVLVGADDVLVRRRGATRSIRRDQVAGAYYDGKKLVIESADGRRLLEESVENAKRDAGPAFRRFGYPWENVE